MKIEIFEGGFDRNLSYLIVDEKSKIGYVVDPFKNIEIYFDKAKDFGVEILGVLNTHSHRDHVEGNPAFLKKGVPVVDSLKEKIKIECKVLKAIKTPGHCDDSVCFYLDFGKDNRHLITGDTLLVKRVGITKDFESSKILFKSLGKLMKLPEDTKVYPGHHYNKKIPTTMKLEKEINLYLQCKNAKEFEDLMDKWRNYTRAHFAKKCC